MLYASRFLKLMNPFMTGPDARAVQDSLSKLGYYKGAVDGVYGNDTADAVQKFQSAVGIRADGIVGPDTWNSLGLAVGPVNINREYRITIDTQSLKLTLAKSGVIQNIYPVAVGKPSTPTPIGDWVIIEKQVDWGGPFGVRWMRLNVPWGGYEIHGTDNPSSIGTAASHGCVRMYNEDVTKLFSAVPMGTPFPQPAKPNSSSKPRLNAISFFITSPLLCLNYYVKNTRNTPKGVFHFNIWLW